MSFATSSGDYEAPCQTRKLEKKIFTDTKTIRKQKNVVIISSRENYEMFKK